MSFAFTKPDTTTDSYDILVTKLDIYGNIIWEKEFGDESSDYSCSIINAPDNCIYIFGNYCSNNFCILKIDSLGNEISYLPCSSNPSDYPFSIIKSKDNNYLIYGDRNNKGVLIKIDNDFNKIWEQVIPFSTNSITYTDDNGYLIGFKYNANFCIMRTDSKGNSDFSVDILK